MAFKSRKTLGQLIDESANVESLHKVSNYGKDKLFEKSFGHIYYSDKVAYYNEEYKILEIRIVFGSKTADNSDVHVVRMAFYDVDGKVYDSMKSLYDEFGYYNEPRGRRATNLSTVSRNERVVNSVFDGIVIPCAKGKYSGDKNGYGKDDRVFYSSKGITLDTPCTVSCTCPSYKYTFAQANWDNGAHLGQRPYIRGKVLNKYKKNKTILVRNKSVKGTKDNKEDMYMDVKNPNFDKWVLNMKHTPGLCKHLMLAALLLLNGDIITPGTKHIRDFNLTLLKRQVREKLAKHNLNNPSDSSGEKKYLSAIDNALRESEKEDIKKKTASTDSYVKEISEDSLEPQTLEQLINNYDLPGSVYEIVASRYLDQKFQNAKTSYSEKERDKWAKNFLRLTAEDSDKFKKLAMYYTSNRYNSYRNEIDAFLQKVQNLNKKGFS